MNKKVLICGGTNFMGPHLVKKCINAGYEVTLLHRGKHLIDLDVKSIIADINQREGEGFSQIKNIFYDCVIACSVYSPQAVSNVLNRIKTNQYILISSMAVYPYYHKDISENEYVKESDLVEYCNMEMNYTIRKRQAETCLIKRFPDVNSAIVRPGYVIDDENPEHNYNQRIREIVNCVLEGRVINSKYIDYLIPFTRAKEEAEFLFQLCDNNICGVFNLSSKGLISIRRIIRYVEKKIGKRAIISDNQGEYLHFIGDGNNGASFNLTRAEGVISLSTVDEWIYKLIDFYIDNYETCINWESVIITGER